MNRIKDQTIFSSSPLRISFIGGGTDLPNFYNLSPGKVFSCCIIQRAFCVLKPRNDKSISLQLQDIDKNYFYENLNEIDYEKHNNIATACISQFRFDNGFDLSVKSDAVPGSGLGGSAAVTVSIIKALAHYSDTYIKNTKELSELAFKVEREILGIPGGMQDQYATASGGLNIISFSKEKIYNNRLFFPSNLENKLRTMSMLFFTGTTRTDLKLVENLTKSLSNRKKNKDYLNFLPSLVDESVDAFFNSDFKKFGELLYEGFKLKLNANTNLCGNTKADIFIQDAIKLGAYGGKLLGAGGGGYVYIISPPENHRNIRKLADTFHFNFSQFAVSHTGATLEIY